MSPKKRSEKEWTVMFYCAGDNELAPLLVSQVKGIKEAGPHKDVNVLVYLDPNEKGVPTRLYCVNQNPPQGERSALDSFVGNMEDDTVAIGRSGPAAKKLGAALKNPDTVKANDALAKFLRFCREKYPANHYALVLMGHGMIVANDAFLPDESPVSAITLKELGRTLDGFRGKLDLLAFHSCSMSGVEVAYELKGKAKYMMGSEGLSFVGSWPYRKMLMKTFSFLNQAHEQNGTADPNTRATVVPELIEKLYFLAYHNAKDFMLSGYSLDLALCSLEETRYDRLTAAIKNLVRALKDGLNDESSKPTQLIQLAHLESQSYYDENYTDLYDFCFCLSKKCQGAGLSRIRNACEDVMTVLEPRNSYQNPPGSAGIVIHSRHFGSHYQYSHGLSVYFPWSAPLGTTKDSVLNKYAKYAFSHEFPKHASWLDFLNLYLEKTKRKSRVGGRGSESETRKMFGPGVLSKPSGGFHKPSGGSGPACSCPSIKNFPTVEMTIKGKCRRLRIFAKSTPRRDEIA